MNIVCRDFSEITYEYLCNVSCGHFTDRQCCWKQDADILMSPWLKREFCRYWDSAVKSHRFQSLFYYWKLTITVIAMTLSHFSCCITWSNIERFTDYHPMLFPNFLFSPHKATISSNSILQFAYPAELHIEQDIIHLVIQVIADCRMASSSKDEDKKISSPLEQETSLNGKLLLHVVQLFFEIVCVVLCFISVADNHKLG